MTVQNALGAGSVERRAEDVSPSVRSGQNQLEDEPPFATAFLSRPVAFE